MLLLLATLAAATVDQAPVKVEQRPRASVTILRPHIASPRSWNPAVRPDQRETIRRDGKGEERLRLTEFQ